jgi:dihydroorotate dehydrogenase subfamily 1
MTPGDRLRRLIRERSAERSGTIGAIPITTVSGVASTTQGMVSWFDRETRVTMITTKSFQPEPNPGNPEPIITEAHRGDYGNAVGLRNPGIETAIRELTELRNTGRLGALLNVSLSADTTEDFVSLARRSAPVADVLELNYSCPHATKGYGADIGRDAEAIATITGAVVAAAGGVPVVVKLTPNVPNIAEMALVAVGAGASGVTAINTVGPEIYVHPDSGTPILSNPPDGRGGKSGGWIKETAIDAITAIREVIGPSPVIIGMGGVSDRTDAERFTAAGADIVGVGSALAGVHQREWPDYIASLAGAAQSSGGGKLGPIHRRESAGMDLQRHEVASRRDLGDDLFELDLTPPVEGEIGQTVFLWVPGIGEKPFAPAVSEGETTTFLIKRRGAVTTALGARTAGDAVYVRGPYGDRWEPPADLATTATTRNGRGVAPHNGRGVSPHNARESSPHTGTALLIGAGSGVATLPLVASALSARGFSVVSLVGVRRAIDSGRVLDALAKTGSLEIVPDEGRVARVVTQITPRGTKFVYDNRIVTAWICGPEAFMREAALRVLETGVPAGRIFLSLERMMRCGVGMCGECHRDGLLTCQFGTVVTAEEVQL